MRFRDEARAQGADFTTSSVGIRGLSPRAAVHALVMIPARAFTMSRIRTPERRAARLRKQASRWVPRRRQAWSAPEAFAEWVAIASISAGDRQS